MKTPGSRGTHTDDDEQDRHPDPRSDNNGGLRRVPSNSKHKRPSSQSASVSQIFRADTPTLTTPSQSTKDCSTAHNALMTRQWSLTVLEFAYSPLARGLLNSIVAGEEVVLFESCSPSTQR